MTLTSNQNSAIIALKEVQKIEELNNFANGDLWNNIQAEIEAIQESARYSYVYSDVIEYEKANGIN
jgi:hypothetical protein